MRWFATNPNFSNYGFRVLDIGGRFAPGQPFRIFWGLQRTIVLESWFCDFLYCSKRLLRGTR